ncbi:MAG: nucleotide exchange factor GrpE [Patescibacteria group bacterium]
MDDKNSNNHTDDEKNNVEEVENNEDDSELLEFEFNDDGEEDLKKTLKKFRTDLKLCQKEKEEYLIGWQKERADFANYKKEENDRKINFSKILQEKILFNFLAVSDSFNLAFANKEAWQKVDKNWRIGVEYIYNQLDTVFKDFGVQSFGEVGENFDPKLHQSIDVTSTDKKENDQKISEVVQKGYKSKDNILRPAQVKIWEYRSLLTPFF